MSTLQLIYSIYITVIVVSIILQLFGSMFYSTFHYFESHVLIVNKYLLFVICCWYTRLVYRGMQLNLTGLKTLIICPLSIVKFPTFLMDKLGRLSLWSQYTCTTYRFLACYLNFKTPLSTLKYINYVMFYILCLNYALF